MTVRRWNEFGSTIRKLFLNMLPVVFGVLLALLINNLNESIKEKSRIKEIRWHILSEIAANLEYCKDFIEEQEARGLFFSEYNDSLDVFSSRGYSFRQLPFRGVRILSLSQTAWDAAQYSGVLSSLDFVDLQGYAGIYVRQQFLLDYQKNYISYYYNNDTYEPALMKSTFYRLRQLNDDYLAFARSLCLNYEYYLGKHQMK